MYISLFSRMTSAALHLMEFHLLTEKPDVWRDPEERKKIEGAQTVKLLSTVYGLTAPDLHMKDWPSVLKWSCRKSEGRPNVQSKHLRNMLQDSTTFPWRQQQHMSAAGKITAGSVGRWGRMCAVDGASWADIKRWEGWGRRGTYHTSVGTSTPAWSRLDHTRVHRTPRYHTGILGRPCTRTCRTRMTRRTAQGRQHGGSEQSPCPVNQQL